MRSWLLLVLAIGGCGFAPQDDFTGRRVGDGAAPWTDLGVVQLCLGNELIGPPATDPGGLCIAGTSAEAPCAGDSDCRSREACVCGRCTVPYCTVNSDCPSGRTCSFSENRCDVVCAETSDCADGEQCFNNTCRARCATTDDCQTGEVCSANNRCVTADCASEADCIEGERCRIQRVPRVAREPTILDTGSGPTRFVMWLELSSETDTEDRAIWRAISADGQRFRIDPARPVKDDGGAAAPSILRDGDGYVLYYEYQQGAEIRVATSPDGIAFGDGQLALAGGVGPAAARAPSAVLRGDEVLLYYQIGDGTAIGLARGPLAGALTSLGPVLEPREVIDRGDDIAGGAWLEVEAVRSPAAAIISGPGGPRLHLWFSAFGRESGDSEQFGEVVPLPPNYSIGYAVTTTDAPQSLLLWPFNPVLDRVSAFLDHGSELDPAVVELVGSDGKPTDAYLLYYVDAETDSAAGPIELGRLGVAQTAATPLAEARPFGQRPRLT